MKTKYFLSFIILGLGITISGVLLSNALAQTAPNIQYPVAELGNCKDETACRAYCDKSVNLKACLAFAEKNNLMTAEELRQAKNFVAAGAKGPGGCVGKDACEEYCNDISRIDECISFAEKNNLMPAQELAEAKKVQAAIKRGVKPPPCGNKQQCDVYCSESDHMEECITFGMEAGFIQGKELEEAQKMLAAVKKGIKPPPCKGKEACDQYCQEPANMEVCMNFAMEAGFMTEQEKQDSQKMLQALKKGVKPPACKGKEECDNYCSQESHFEECTKFAEAAGFMTPEEAAMARKTGGKGPGGCKGRDECEAFCNNPANQETCFNFAKEHGMISEGDLRQMEEGKQRFQESLNQAPAEVINCLTSVVGSEQMEKFRSGAAMPSQEIGEKMRECFEKTMGPGMPGGPEMMGPTGPAPQGGMPAGMTGPGGCKTPEECQAYCQNNPQECQNFGPAMSPQGQEMMQNMMPGQQMMPGKETMPGKDLLPGQNLLPGQEMMPPKMEGQMPTGEFQQPPMNQMPPQEQMMAPMEQMPPTSPTEPPPPSSAINQSLFGFIFSILNPMPNR